MSQDGTKPDYPLLRFGRWVKLGLYRHLTPTERDVLTVYATYANPNTGSSWPAVETIRQVTGHSRTRIFEALRVLRRLKILDQVGRTVRKGMEELGSRGPMIYTVTEPPASLPEGFGLSVHAARTQGPLTVHNVRTHSAGRFTPPSTSRECHRPHDGKVPSTSRETDRPRHEDREGVLKGKEQGVLEGECEGKPFVPGVGYIHDEETPPPPPQGGAVFSLSSSQATEEEKTTTQEKPTARGKSKSEERREEEARLFFEGQATMGGGLRTWAYWEAYFPPQYNRAMLREAYDEVVRRFNHEAKP